MLATVTHDLRQWLREPRALLVSLLVPLTLLVIAILAGTVGTGYTVAVVTGQPSDVRAALLGSPYLRAREMSRPDAAAALASGEVAGSFDTVDGLLVLAVAPYGNDDVRRNLAMRQQVILAEVNTARLAGAGRPHLAVTVKGLLPNTVSDQAYLAAGIVVFTALFSGLANTAYATARELERGTAAYLLASPLRPTGLLAAKVATGTLQSALAVGAALGVVGLGLGVRPVGHTALLGAVLLATTVGSAALGVVLGVWARRIVPALLVSVVAALVAWFAGGGFAPVTQQPDALRVVAFALPPAWAISAGQRLINGLGTIGPDIAHTLAAGAASLPLGLLVAGVPLRRPDGVRP